MSLRAGLKSVKHSAAAAVMYGIPLDEVEGRLFAFAAELDTLRSSYAARSPGARFRKLDAALPPPPFGAVPSPSPSIGSPALTAAKRMAASKSLPGPRFPRPSHTSPRHGEGKVVILPELSANASPMARSSVVHLAADRRPAPLSREPVGADAGEAPTPAKRAKLAPLPPSPHGPHTQLVSPSRLYDPAKCNSWRAIAYLIGMLREEMRPTVSRVHFHELCDTLRQRGCIPNPSAFESALRANGGLFDRLDENGDGLLTEEEV
jgi:hypothetical protein